MTDSTAEADLLASLVPQLEAEGYDVYVHPSRSLLPSFMSYYVPDVVALGEQKKIAIEIKRPTAGAEENLAKISALFEGQKEWEFKVLWATPTSMPRTLRVQALSAIEEIVSEIQSLLDSNHYRPALLLSWAAFEATGRTLAERRLAKPQTPSRLVEVLAAEGYLTPSEADDLRLLADKRNRLVHGEIDAQVTRGEVERFLNILKALGSMTGDTSH